MTDAERMDAMDDEMREWFSDMSPERRAVITSRMGKQIEERVGTWDDDTDPVLVEEVFIDVAEKMYLQDTLDQLAEQGLINCIGIDGDGNFMYAAAEEAQ